MTDDEAGEHVLQLAGTHERPSPGVHIGTPVASKACAAAFDLVANERVNGADGGAPWPCQPRNFFGRSALPVPDPRTGLEKGTQMLSQSMRRAVLTATLFAAPGFALAQTTAPTPPQAPSAPTARAPSSVVVVAPVAGPSSRRASSLIGANIINEENRTVGEVHDLMVDTAGGATIAVLSVGGFLGMGERYIAIPLSELRWNNERERWSLPGATVDNLKARPAFTYPERR